MSLVRDYQLTAVDGVTINDDDITVRYGGTRGAFVINTDTRRRAGLAPVVDSFTQGVRSQVLIAHKTPGSNLTKHEFDELVNGLFWPALGERTLTLTYDGNTFTTMAYVTALQDVSDAPGIAWEIEVDIPSGLWHAVTEQSTSTSPVVITGNVPALPKLTIMGGNACTRQRVTFTDRTGHGVAAYMVSVEPSEALSEANYDIWANGLRIPFAYTSGRLYFRIDAPPPPERTFVDIYMGASIDNTTTAGELDAAGTDLAATLAAGQVDADTDFAIDNPLAPMLAWHPSITVPHESRRDYVYGLDGHDIVLIDQNAAGQRTSLPNDADSYIIATSEAIRIRNLSLSVFSGYQKSIQEATGSGGSRRMRIRIASASSFGAANDDWHYVQWKFGDLVYPSTEHIQHAAGHMVWHEVAHVENFAAETAKALGITPVQQEPGTWILTFPANAYKGQDIPLITMSSTRRNLGPDFAGDVDPSGDSAPIPAHLFTADWVDAAGNPIQDDPATADLLPVALKGQIKTAVVYRTRDSEHWMTAWSQVVTGASPNGSTVNIGPLSVETPGAVEIAIRLEPVAAKPSLIDWGRLTITSVPIIDLDTSKTPSAVVSAAIPALHISGTVRNVRTGAQITLTDVFADGGIEIDTEQLLIQGFSGVGPVYGGFQTNKGAAMFQLMPGQNEWTMTGDLELEDVTLEWRERLAV